MNIDCTWGNTVKKSNIKPESESEENVDRICLPQPVVGQLQQLSNQT